MKHKLLFILIGSALSFAGHAQAIDELMGRVSENTSGNIRTEIAASGDGKDFFEIGVTDGKPLIRGNNTVSIATGFNWYLKYTAGIHISWNNLTRELPADLPLLERTVRRETSLRQRYYLNYCTFSYSMAFWDWPRWEKELDWMAMHGINLALSITGSEAVWRNLLKRAGYTAGEINGFVAGPAYQAWWQMNNLEGWGGPNPEEWYANRETLQKKIIARMRELGIEPVLPGFAGMVPRNIGEKLGYDISDPGTWCTFDRPAFLRPDDPHFDRFADMYYEELEKLYGKAKYYAIDPFHEGGSIAGIDLAHAGETIMAAMKRANPAAVWVVQAWHANPRPAMIGNLDAHDLLVLDLYSEKMPQWGGTKYRPDGYGRHDWLYCMLLNFGGRVGLHGRMERVINGFYDAKEHPDGRTLAGVGATPEGIENNPVMFELLYELPWRGERFTREEWLASYVGARYGRYDRALHDAWLLLARGPYNCPNDYPGEGTVESLFCARPSIDPQRVSSWGSAVLFYDPDVTRRAAEKMLSAAGGFGDNYNFRYDLADILRQSLADRGNALSAEIGRAYAANDADRFSELSDSFLSLILCQDRLLATHGGFRVGTWLGRARSLSGVEANRDLYEWNARTLITVWGNRQAAERGGLHDYSAREWNGLLADLYHRRWAMFFDNTLKEMRGESVAPLDFHAVEHAWTHERKEYGDAPEGDAVRTAAEVYRQVFGGD